MFLAKIPADESAAALNTRPKMTTPLYALSASVTCIGTALTLAMLSVVAAGHFSHPAITPQYRSHSLLVTLLGSHTTAKICSHSWLDDRGSVLSPIAVFSPSPAGMALGDHPHV